MPSPPTKVSAPGPPSSQSDSPPPTSESLPDPPPRKSVPSAEISVSCPSKPSRMSGEVVPIIVLERLLPMPETPAKTYWSSVRELLRPISGIGDVLCETLSLLKTTNEPSSIKARLLRTSWATPEERTEGVASLGALFPHETTEPSERRAEN